MYRFFVNLATMWMLASLGAEFAQHNHFEMYSIDWWFTLVATLFIYFLIQRFYDKAIEHVEDVKNKHKQ